jgi:hypothetical protein
MAVKVDMVEQRTSTNTLVEQHPTDTSGNSSIEVSSIYSSSKNFQHETIVSAADLSPQLGCVNISSKPRVASSIESIADLTQIDFSGSNNERSLLSNSLQYDPLIGGNTDITDVINISASITKSNQQPDLPTSVVADVRSFPTIESGLLDLFALPVSSVIDQHDFTQRKHGRLEKPYNPVKNKQNTPLRVATKGCNNVKIDKKSDDVSDRSQTVISASSLVPSTSREVNKQKLRTPSGCDTSSGSTSGSSTSNSESSSEEDEITNISVKRKIQHDLDSSSDDDVRSPPIKRGVNGSKKRRIDKEISVKHVEGGNKVKVKVDQPISEILQANGCDIAEAKRVFKAFTEFSGKLSTHLRALENQFMDFLDAPIDNIRTGEAISVVSPFSIKKLYKRCTGRRGRPPKKISNE